MAQSVTTTRSQNDRPRDEEIAMGDLRHTTSQISTTENNNSAAAVTDSSAPLTLPVITKLSSACFAFCVAGITDGSFGALVPYILDGYGIGTGSVAIIYASSFTGWVIAAILGGYVRAYTGSGGSLVLGAAIQLFAQILRVWKPPFGLFCFTFFLVAIGQAFQDSQSNTFVSTIKSAHRWLGVIHASYSIGLLIGPFVATSIAVSNPSRWPLAFYFPLGLGVANLVLVTWAFREEIVLSKPVPTENEEVQITRRGDRVWQETKDTLKKKVVWLLSMFYFFYLGATFTAGGWLVEYLVAIRDIKLSKAGYVPTAFYGGTVLGRLLLPEPTYRFGEKKMLLLYAILCCALEVVFWRVDNFIANTIVVAGMGFFLGPNFATGISVATKLIPKEIHASALGFIFVVAQAGAAMFPALTGLIAIQAGVGTLQPVLIGLLVAMALSWLLVPKVDKKAE